jgi:hypothetical protein
VWNDALDLPCQSGKMSMGLQGVRATIVDDGVDMDKSGEGPQNLLDLLLVPARNRDPRGLPQMLKRVC